MNVPIVPALIGSILGWPFKEAAKVALSATSGWIVAGAQAILAEVVKVISLITTPSLTASWFSASYWRIAGLAMLLTVPFLFAAAVQAVVRTDLGVLLRAAFIDLPIAVLAVTLTAPVVALLLAATDEMCAVMTGGGTAGGAFLTQTGTDLSTMHSSCMLAVIAVVILLAGLVLMVELIMRAAAIYIVVLFLPLGFAAMVWPARRIWIKRMVELLIALILSKFAMVAILSLAVSGLASGLSSNSLTTAVSAMALMVLAAFSPWALLRLLPFTEIAAGAGAMLHHETRHGVERGATIGRNAAGLAAAPVAAGAEALGRLVRSGAQSESGEGGGLPLLPSRDGAGSNLSRGGAPRPPAAETPAGGAPQTTVQDSVSARGASGSGTTGATAGTSHSGPAYPDFDDPSPVPVAGSGTSGGPPSGGPPRLAPDPLVDVGDSSDPNAPVKGAVADLAPIYHPDNEGLEMNLSGDGSGWVRSSGEATTSSRDNGSAGGDW